MRGLNPAKRLRRSPAYRNRWVLLRRQTYHELLHGDRGFGAAGFYGVVGFG
jgi:hypothetical protein